MIQKVSSAVKRESSQQPSSALSPGKFEDASPSKFIGRGKHLAEVLRSPAGNKPPMPPGVGRGLPSFSSPAKKVSSPGSVKSG